MEINYYKKLMHVVMHVGMVDENLEDAVTPNALPLVVGNQGNPEDVVKKYTYFHKICVLSAYFAYISSSVFLAR